MGSRDVQKLRNVQRKKNHKLAHIKIILTTQGNYVNTQLNDTNSYDNNDNLKENCQKWILRTTQVNMNNQLKFKNPSIGANNAPPIKMIVFSKYN